MDNKAVAADILLRPPHRRPLGPGPGQALQEATTAQGLGPSRWLRNKCFSNSAGERVSQAKVPSHTAKQLFQVALPKPRVHPGVGGMG